jgi:hypothetical protein
MKINMTKPTRLRNVILFFGLVLAFIHIMTPRMSVGANMISFESLKNLSERIIRERAYDPQQLAVLLGAKFDMADDDLPNLFQYYATLDGNEFFDKCDLRAPKTPAAKNAILVCYLHENDMTDKDVHKAYGESVQSRQARASSGPSVPHYLSVDFDHARLSFGYAKKSKMIKRVVIKFEL